MRDARIPERPTKQRNAGSSLFVFFYPQSSRTRPITSQTSSTKYKTSTTVVIRPNPFEFQPSIPVGSLSVVAGGQNYNEGGPATSAALPDLRGIAVDSVGNVYVSNFIRNSVAKIGIDGNLTHFAGSPDYTLAGYDGDGVPATSARLANPAGLAVDSSGSLLIVDSGNYRIRKVFSNGTIVTIAGNGSFGLPSPGGPATSSMLPFLNGIAVDNTTGHVYFTSTDFSSDYRVFKISSVDGALSVFAGNGSLADGGDGKAATSTAIGSPMGVAVDSTGQVYISDAYFGKVRVVSLDGKIKTVGAKPSSPGLSQPSQMAVGPNGVLYVADTPMGRVYAYTSSGSPPWLTFAGSTSGFSGDGGAPTSAQMSGTKAVAVSPDGNTVWVADGNNCRVRKITGGLISTIAGGICQFSGDGGPGTSALLHGPSYIAPHPISGEVFFIDLFNYRVRKLGSGGNVSLVAGRGSDALGSSSSSGDGGPATAASFSNSWGLAIHPIDSSIYVGDLAAVRRIDHFDSGIITTVAGTPGAGGFGYSGDGGPATSAKLGSIRAIAFDRSGNYYVAADDRTIRKVATNTTISLFAGTKSVSGSSGDGGPATSARIGQVQGLTTATIDGHEILFLSDYSFHTIRKINLTTGLVSFVAGEAGTADLMDGAFTSARFGYPKQISADRAGRFLYVADYGNSAIRKLDLVAETITTLVGNNSNYGDFIGVIASPPFTTQPLLGYPFGVAVGWNDTIFIGDTHTQKIKAIRGNSSI